MNYSTKHVSAAFIKKEFQSEPGIQEEFNELLQKKLDIKQEENELLQNALYQKKLKSRFHRVYPIDCDAKQGRRPKVFFDKKILEYHDNSSDWLEHMATAT